MMTNLFILLLFGLPFAHFIFHRVNIWIAMGHWFQVCLLCIFAASFYYKPVRKPILNIPLGAFFLYAGLNLAFLWYNIVSVANEYPAKMMFTFFNLLCFIMFYKLSTEYLQRKDIEKILRFMSYSVLVVLVYCVLQVFGLDQFYNPLPRMGAPSYDELVGTIGNSTHLAGYLALCLPLFFTKTKLGVAGIILTFIIILLTKSASGIVVAVAVSIFYLFHREKIFAFFLGAISLLIATAVMLKMPLFFNPSGRFELWKMIYPRFENNAITGWGLGIMDIWNINHLNSTWKHAHQAYYEVGIEMGLVGVALLSWVIFAYFKRFNGSVDSLSLKLKSIFLGFCLLGFVSFSDRLWLLSSMGMVGYSFMYVL